MFTNQNGANIDHIISAHITHTYTHTQVSNMISSYDACAERSHSNLMKKRRKKKSNSTLTHSHVNGNEEIETKYIRLVIVPVFVCLSVFFFLVFRRLLLLPASHVLFSFLSILDYFPEFSISKFFYLIFHIGALYIFSISNCIFSYEKKVWFDKAKFEFKNNNNSVIIMNINRNHRLSFFIGSTREHNNKLHTYTRTVSAWIIRIWIRVKTTGEQLKKPVILPASHKWRSKTSVFFRSKRSYIERKVTRIKEKYTHSHTHWACCCFWYFFLFLSIYQKVKYDRFIQCFVSQAMRIRIHTISHESKTPRVYKCHGRVRARSRSHRVSQKWARKRHTLR